MLLCLQFLQGAGLRIKASRLASTITIIKPHDVLCGLAVIAWHPLLRTLTTAHISRTMDVPEETPTRLTIETAGTSTKHLRLTIVVMAYFIHSTSLWNALIFLNLPVLRKAIRRFVCFVLKILPLASWATNTGYIDFGFAYSRASIFLASKPFGIEPVWLAL